MEWSQTWHRVSAFVLVCCGESFGKSYVSYVFQALSSMAERFRLVIQMRLLFLILSSCFFTRGAWWLDCQCAYISMAALTLSNVLDPDCSRGISSADHGL